jgi:RND family efflux transporter MFP subunit
MKYTKFVALMLVVISACRHPQVKENTISAKDINMVHVKTSPVLTQKENSLISVIGYVLSDSESKPSFKTGGVINKTYTKEGDAVIKGQLLATLNLSEINAQVNQAEEGLMKAERDQKRAKNMHNDSVATLEQVQNATTALEIARKNVEIAKFNRTYSEVRSPINGKVIKQLMHTGEIVGPGTPVCAIMGVGNKDWKINAGLIDRDWARVSVGNDVVIEMDAYPGKVFQGKLSKKTSVGGSASGTFDIEITFKSQPANLAAGLITRLAIKPKVINSLTLIPLDAIVKSNGNYAEVFTIVDGKAKKLKLKIASILGDQLAISDGLEGASEIVTIGAMYLEEGDQVSK